MPNEWDLHHMLGNVREWCHDWMGTYPGTVTDPWGPVTGPNKVIRGGSWVLVAELSRAASRLSGPLDHRSHEIGFRIARTLP